MNKRMILYTLGLIFLLEAGLLAVPLAISVFSGDGIWSSYLIPMAVLLVLGLPAVIRQPQSKVYSARSGLVIVALSWLILSAFGALPFWISGAVDSFVDCLFESVSGFTTTGATILSEVESLPHSLLFWRSFSQWIGGMGVLVLVLAIIPQSDMRSIHLLRAEVPGPQVGKLVSRLRSTARILYLIYCALTVIQIILLLCGGLSLFDSVTTALSTASTGGFGVRNNSIIAYNSAYVEVVVGVFMLLFGVNFNLFYLILLGKISKAIRNEELCCYLAVFGISTILVSVNIFPLYGNFLESLRYAFFQVASTQTSTGFMTADFGAWPVFSQTLLVILMLIGSCAGSTGGGIKIARWIMMVKLAFNDIRQMLFPRSIHQVKLEGEAVDREVIAHTNSYFILYVTVLLASVLIISIEQKGLVTNLTAVVTCLNDVGPGLEMVGPTGNFGSFSVLSKFVLMFDMLAGRLEFFPLLSMFFPLAWRKK